MNHNAIRFIYKRYIQLVFSIVTLFFTIASIEPVFSQPSVLPENHEPSKKIFSFGLIADPQYADAETKGNRYYRNSLLKLENCIRELNNHNLSFTITFGDLIDRDYLGFDKILPILNKSKVKVYNVLGNHDFEVDEKFRKDVRSRLNNENGYFDFTYGDLVFIILDGSDLSTFGRIKGSKQYSMAVEKLEQLKDTKENNAYDWNGGMGLKQLKWLERKLQKSSRLNKKVVLFCHWPLLPENGTQLWDNQKVLAILNKYDNVIAWISGHHHEGGYQKVAGIHHLTLKGMVESERETAFAIIEVYNNKLILNGFGAQDKFILEF